MNQKDNKKTINPFIRNLIEDYKEINGIKCYGVDNRTLIKLLMDSEYVPIAVGEKNGKHLHYFKRDEEFDFMVDFYKYIMSGGLFHWMVKRIERYHCDQWFDPTLE